MPHDEENFTDEVIEDFFEAIEPICSLVLNQHGLDIINNMAVVTVLTQSLLLALAEDDDDTIEAVVRSLRMAYPHSPGCYIEITERLENVWRSLFDEEYVEHLYGEDDPHDD